MSPLDYILSVNGPVRGVVRTLLPNPLTTPINTPLGITPPGRGGGGVEVSAIFASFVMPLNPSRLSFSHE
jgi:hypothetical protein